MLLLVHHQRSDGEIDTYHLKPGRKFHLGRGSTCEIRILDLSLSRRHAALEWLDGHWTITDLMSTNGCRLDGDPLVGTRPVQDGTVIAMGQTTLVAALRPLVDATAAVDQEPLPDDDEDDGIPVPAPLAIDEESGHLTPQAESPRVTTSSALALNRVAVMVEQREPGSGEQRYVITVLGQRVGPLTHSQAHTLKEREKAGTLQVADLESYPRPA
jgi:pSer/pThr/pTyr-binding forkhead associated (FHA) protein